MTIAHGVRRSTTPLLSVLIGHLGTLVQLARPSVAQTSDGATAMDDSVGLGTWTATIGSVYSGSGVAAGGSTSWERGSD